MGWIDDLLGKRVQTNGTNLPDRKILNFKGVGVSAADNPATGATDVTIGSSTTGVDPLTPQVGGGYPSGSGFAIAFGSSFIRGTPSNGDSVRFFGAGGIEPVPVAFMSGRVINTTSAIVNLYPLPSQHLFTDTGDQGAGNPVAIAPGATILWTLDASLNGHITG